MSGSDEPGDRRRQAISINGWEFRYDSPPPEGAPRQVLSGDVLAQFRAFGAVNRFDRRECPRYSPFRTRAQVGWWQGKRFRVTRAALLNLSRGGALVRMGHRPPTSQPVWICLVTAGPAHHVQARVLEVATANDGVQRVRLQFHTPCPVLFFLTAGRRDEPPE